MPTYQQTIQARDRAKRIRLVHHAFRLERVMSREDAAQIRNVLKFGAETEVAS